MKLADPAPPRPSRRSTLASAAAAAAAGLAGTAAAQPAARSAFPPPPDPAQPVRLRHVTLFVHDQDLVARWYVQHLGFQEIDRRVLAREDGVRFDSVQIGIGGLWINVSRLPNLARRDPALTYAGWRHIALAVRDVPGTWARLRAAGVDVLGPAPYRFAVEGSRFGAQSYVAGFLRDPEGNVVELYEDLA